MSKYINGENGSLMFNTTGDVLLDLFSSSTRIDLTNLNKYDNKSKRNESKHELNQFNLKLDKCLNLLKDKTSLYFLDTLKYFVINGFYMRDIKEKGERTLFNLFFY